MVEDNFNQKVKENQITRSNIEVITPIDNLIKNLKDELRKYNNMEDTSFKIKIMDKEREVGIISS